MCLIINLHVVVNMTFEVTVPLLLMITISIGVSHRQKWKKRTKDKAAKSKKHTKDK